MELAARKRLKPRQHRTLTFMAQVDRIDQTWTEEIILFSGAHVVFHRQTKIAGFLMKSSKPGPEMARKPPQYNTKSMGWVLFRMN